MQSWKASLLKFSPSSSTSPMHLPFFCSFILEWNRVKKQKRGWFLSVDSWNLGKTIWKANFLSLKNRWMNLRRNNEPKVFEYQFIQKIPKRCLLSQRTVSRGAKPIWPEIFSLSGWISALQIVLSSLKSHLFFDYFRFKKFYLENKSLWW